VKCVPFETVRAFYEEYQIDCEKNCVLNDAQASYKTFSAAYKSIKKSLRLMRCKGNFSCCEICENAAGILRDRNRLKSETARNIVKKYDRSIHLQQQMNERVNLDLRIREARKVDPINGQPNSFLILPDGMTSKKGDLPKFGQRKVYNVVSNLNNMYLYILPIRFQTC